MYEYNKDDAKVQYNIPKSIDNVTRIFSKVNIIYIYTILKIMDYTILK